MGSTARASIFLFGCVCALAASALPFTAEAQALPPLPDSTPTLWPASDQFAAVAHAQSTSTPEATPLTSLDIKDRATLIALTRPTIVRILAKAFGTSTMPAFTIDFNTFTWKLLPDEEPVEEFYENYFSGSGFIISPDGYILTNSHVVSNVTLTQSLASNIAWSAYYEAYDSKKMDQALINKLNAEFEEDPEAFYARAGKAREEGTEFVKQHLKVPLLSLVVVKPEITEATTTSAYLIRQQTSTREELIKKLDDMAGQGASAELVYENRNFLDDERDVAIIKIDLSNLPSLRLGSSETTRLGDEVYLFGYPSNADYSLIDPEPSFTEGSINALKDSIQKTFKYIQTDAKSSPGSSGGPLFNVSGEAVGLLTLSLGGSLFSTGDSFALAVPISIAKDAVAAAGIQINHAQDYASHLHLGLRALQEKRCQTALEHLDAAASMESFFDDTRKYVEPYIDECLSLITAGGSIDTLWDEIKNWVELKGVTFWSMLAGAGVLLAGLAAGVLFLVKRLAKEEQLIAKLEQEIEHPHVAPVSVAPAVATPVTAPAAATANVSPELTSYILAARAQGQTDEQIKTALIAIGWNGEDIVRALSH